LVWVIVGFALIAIAFYMWRQEGKQLAREIDAIAEKDTDLKL